MARRPKPQKDPALSAALRQAVEALREESLQCAEGELIGSEDDLLARHKVSRPTLRQAAALVASEQLLQVRRGVGGGYIARRPTGRAVTHMAAIFLRSRGASLDEISRSKPSAAKGRYIRKVTFATTMGPGVPVDPNRSRNLLEDGAE